MNFGQITIIGVGLIGGSIGLAVKQRKLATVVYGVGRDERNLERARASGALDRISTNLKEACAKSDFIVVCTPVDRVAADVLAAAQVAPSHCVITDVGSTKGNILAELNGKMPSGGATFIGSHPLAGSEKRGAAHAKADLFTDRLVVVTPIADTDTEVASVVDLFWQNLGARIMRMDPHEHDRALAFTSHLPHAAASALAGVTPIEWLNLTAGGFKDTTRIAAGDAELWAAIFEANRDAVLTSLAAFTQQLERFRDALETRDHTQLIQWLIEGKRIRDALGS